MSPKLQELAKQFLFTSDDRMKNYIEVDGDRLDLEPKATLQEAKAQWADALWIVQKLLERSQRE